MRFQRDSGNTSTVGCQMFYNLETADALRFAGQTVTVSFYARAGANFSANSSQFSYIVYTGTGTDQRRDQSTGYTGEAQAANSSITLTTSWQRFQFTASIGSTATEIAIALGYTPTGTAGAADYADITGIQLEVGSVATTFKRSNGAGGTIQGELAACQRYYYRQNWQALSNYAVFGTGFANTTGAMYVETTFPVNMRVKPTAVDTAAMSLYAFEVGVTFISTPTTIALDSNYSSPNNGTLAITKSGSFTVGTYYRMSANNNSGAYIGWSAEL
jgi:hypothetical protein